MHKFKNKIKLNSVFWTRIQFNIGKANFLGSKEKVHDYQKSLLKYWKGIRNKNNMTENTQRYKLRGEGSFQSVSWVLLNTKYLSVKLYFAKLKTLTGSQVLTHRHLYSCFSPPRQQWKQLSKNMRGISFTQGIALLGWRHDEHCQDHTYGEIDFSHQTWTTTTIWALGLKWQFCRIPDD